MRARNIIGFLIWLCLSMACPLMRAHAQQGALFTQYMFNPIIINPAYAGSEEALKLTLINRSQWVSVDGAPTTQGLYASSLFRRQHIGVGLSFVNDKIGIHKNQDVRGMVAYHLPISGQATLSFGMQAGLSMSRSNYAALNGTGTTLDPQLAGTAISTTSLSMGMGAYFNSKRFHMGLSMPSVLPQTSSLNDTLSVTWKRVNYLLYAKYDFALGENMRLEPSILLKYYPGSPLSFDINTCLVIRNALTLGLSYRKKESIDFLMKAQLTKQLQFGYSYDHVTGQVVNASRGTHEISVAYLFKFSHDNVDSPR